MATRRYPTAGPGDTLGYSNHYGTREAVEEENEAMEDSLSAKTKALKSMTIDIGNEIRLSNRNLDTMNDDFDKSGGFLQQTMGRLKALSRGSHNRHILYLLLFCFGVFLFTWLYLKLRS